MASRCDVLVCTLEFQSIWIVREPWKRVFVSTIFLGGNQPGTFEMYIRHTDTSTSLVVISRIGMLLPSRETYWVMSWPLAVGMLTVPSMRMKYLKPYAASGWSESKWAATLPRT